MRGEAGTIYGDFLAILKSTGSHRGLSCREVITSGFCKDWGHWARCGLVLLGEGGPGYPPPAPPSAPISLGLRPSLSPDGPIHPPAAVRVSTCSFLPCPQASRIPLVQSTSIKHPLCARCVFTFVTTLSSTNNPTRKV